MAKRTAVLSFDEGPGKFTMEIAENLHSRGISCIFHFSPSSKYLKKEIVEDILKLNHNLGLYVDQDIDESYSRDDINDIINVNLLEFIIKTGYSPKAIRLSRCGYTDLALEICKERGFATTLPNLDSEDLERLDFDNHLAEHIQNPYKDRLSIVLRDKLSRTNQKIGNVVQKIISNGFQIVPMTEYLQRCLRPTRYPQFYYKNYNNNKSEEGELDGTSEEFKNPSKPEELAPVDVVGNQTIAKSGEREMPERQEVSAEKVDDTRKKVDKPNGKHDKKVENNNSNPKVIEKSLSKIQEQPIKINIPKTDTQKKDETVKISAKSKAAKEDYFEIGIPYYNLIWAVSMLLFIY